MKYLAYIATITVILAVGMTAFFLSQKPRESPPAVIPSPSEKLSQTAERPFVHFTNVFQAENYDIGGPEVSFHAAQTANDEGLNYRADAVNVHRIWSDHGGYAIGRLRVGDWFNYTVVVGTDGSYALRVHGATDQDGEKYGVSVDGQSVSHFRLSNTGSKDKKFASSTSEPFTLTAGQHTLQVKLLETGREALGGNLDWFQGVKMGVLEPQPD